MTNDVWRKILAAALTKACLEEHFRLIAHIFMPSLLHLLALPENPQSKVCRLLARTKQPASKQIRELLEANDSDLVRQLTVQERPSKFCFRFWQEGHGFDRNLFSAEAVSSSIDDIDTNPVKRGLCRVAIDDKWSSAWFHLESIINADLPMLHRPAPELFHNSGPMFEVP